MRIKYRLWAYIFFLVCGPIIPIRMGSPSDEAKFQLWGKTEHPMPRSSSGDDYALYLDEKDFHLHAEESPTKDR